MLKRKPVYPTDRSPEEIIGINTMPLVESHFTLSQKHYETDKWENAIKRKFTEAERAKVALAYEKLREYGIYPSNINRYGSIEFKIMVRSDLQDYVESLPLVPRNEAKREVDINDPVPF